MSISDELDALTYDDCLGNHPDSPCGGAVEMRYTFPERYRTNGTPIMFPRCDRHYDDYSAKAEERERLEREREASLYCVHGTYVGDPYGADYLCGLCESE